MTTSSTNPNGKFRLLSFGDVLTMRPQKHLVMGLLHSSAISALIGASNTGKTFLALDLCLHIAIGKDWFGRTVTQSPVVYIAAEGAVGIQNRLLAFKDYHNLQVDPPLFLLPFAPNMLTPSDVDALINEINSIGSVGLVVIDTLNRALGGGDENGPKDMGTFYSACDLVRQKTNAHILIVHHTGKEKKKGARGHNSLRGNIDTEIILENNSNDRSFTDEKQRDFKKDNEFKFDLFEVDLGFDTYGNPLSSCVVVPLSQTKTATKNAVMDAKRAALFKKIENEILKGQEFEVGPSMRLTTAITISDFRSIIEASYGQKVVKRESVSTASRRALKSFIEDGLLETDQYLVWIPDRHDKAL